MSKPKSRSRTRVPCARLSSTVCISPEPLTLAPEDFFSVPLNAKYRFCHITCHAARPSAHRPRVPTARHPFAPKLQPEPVTLEDGTAGAGVAPSMPLPSQLRGPVSGAASHVASCRIVPVARWGRLAGWSQVCERALVCGSNRVGWLLTCLTRFGWSLIMVWDSLDSTRIGAWVSIAWLLVVRSVMFEWSGGLKLQAWWGQNDIDRSL